jgi:hypothetical protein
MPSLSRFSVFLRTPTTLRVILFPMKSALLVAYNRADHPLPPAFSAAFADLDGIGILRGSEKLGIHVNSSRA